MGTLEVFLCVFVGHFVAVQSVINEQDATFPRDFPGFFGNMVPFPFERQFFTPFDTIFSSWRTPTPDFHMLAELPPIMHIPKVEVFCNESKLTVLVDKRSNGFILTGEEMQLGDSCYSNRELPHQFVFTYSLDECGTARVMQSGVEVYTNSLHLNLRKPPSTWWHTPSTVPISCIPKRSSDNPHYFISPPLPEKSKTFNIKAMNPSWTSSAESNVYKRGQVVNLQVSAKTRPEQQLFIQSCFVSVSPEPQTNPRHAVIMNKGCTAPLGSQHAVVQFVASNRTDVVNFVFNTSYLISELYIHCSVLISDQGVTSGSKSCNYNVFQSRWEDLSGTEEVCECCSSKCKSLSVKHLSEGAKAIVSIGPLIIVDKTLERSPEQSLPEPQETSSAPAGDSMQSDGAATGQMIFSGTSLSRNEFSSPPQGVVIVSQDPVARLTLWLPGKMQDAGNGKSSGSESEDNLTVQLKASDTESKDLTELQPSATDQMSLSTRTNEVGDQNADEQKREAESDLNFLTLVSGWVIPPHLEEAAIAEESQRKMRFGRSEIFGTEASREADIPLEAQMSVNVPNQNDLNHMRDQLAQRQGDAAVMPQDGTNNPRPILRSKIEFSKGMDGSQRLSYEEEVVRQQDRKGEPTQKGLRSTFLDLLSFGIFLNEPRLRAVRSALGESRGAGRSRDTLHAGVSSYSPFLPGGF
ncbi:hypothetical protein L3Q82_026714 [Scortum barcoo]|uniref:Uncharacterized protein n=1 Tax=Scortum barcoo TaxID=214431 RepID=A0ACB8WMH4_9TELE|nr:hypothetical protein L3Q82_026714 [Scortum barcoo]